MFTINLLIFESLQEFMLIWCSCYPRVSGCMLRARIARFSLFSTVETHRYTWPAVLDHFITKVCLRVFSIIRLALSICIPILIGLTVTHIVYSIVDRRQSNISKTRETIKHHKTAEMTSYVAIATDSDFTLDNLPYGVFSTSDNVCVLFFILQILFIY